MYEANLFHSAAFARDAAIWRELRAYWYGRHHEVMPAVFQRLYPKAWAQGKIEPLYMGILRAYAAEVAPTFLRPTMIRGKPETVAKIESWEDVIGDAWGIASVTDVTWLQAAFRGGDLDLDLILGDQIVGEPDEEHTNKLQSLRKLGVTVAGGVWQYHRAPGGRVIASMVTMGGAVPKPWPFLTSSYPVIDIRRATSDEALPRMNVEWTQAQRTSHLQLTDADHHRHWLPGQPYISGGEREQSEADEVVGGPSVLMMLREGETYGHAAPGGNLTESLGFIREILKLRARMRGISPETFDVQSDAETGPAKGWDNLYNLEARADDRRRAVKWLRRFVTWISPFLAQAGYDPRGLEIEPAVWEPPQVGDPLHRAQEAELSADLGLRGMVERIATEDGSTHERAGWKLIQNLRERIWIKRALETGDLSNPPFAFAPPQDDKRPPALPAPAPGGGPIYVNDLL